MRARAATMLLAGALAACSPASSGLPYRPAVQPAGATVSAAYTVVSDRLRVEIDGGGRRVERAQIVRPDGSVLEAQTIEYTPGGGGGGSPLSIGLGVGGFGTGSGVGGGVGVSTGGLVGGGASAAGSSIASFPLAEAGPRPWRVRVTLVGVEPVEILVGDPEVVGGGLDGPLRALPQRWVAPAKPALERRSFGRTPRRAASRRPRRD